ncbi:MAG: sulfotransferase family 2 domain-containing protein [Actinobacteria bacterium]|nr:sulfotransferase family 2 domain-containing protein [Actinomycetota bacterium]
MGADRLAERPAVIFLHIPKTGGLTLRHFILQQAPAERIYESRLGGGPREKAHIRHIQGEDDPYTSQESRPLEARTEPNGPFLEQLRAMPPERFRGLRILFDHFWFGLHEHLPMPATYITLIRNPVERVLSLYHYRLKQGLDMSLERYVAAARDFQLWDGRTRRVAGRDPHGGLVGQAPATEEMLEVAKENLVGSFSVVGVTERFDEALVLMNRELGWRLVPYDRYNVTRGRISRGDLPPRVLSRIEELNRFDARLHAFAAELMERQIDSMGPSFRRAAATFRIKQRVFQGSPPIARRAYFSARTRASRLKRALGRGGG